MQTDDKKLGWMMFALRTFAVLAFALTTTYAYSASKTVLVLGDSLSAEYGLVRGTGWVSLLEKRIKAEKIDASVVNASISGETTSGGKARLPALLDQHRPSVVVIELGGNDGLRGLPLAATEANLRAMVTASQMAKAKVLLIGMQIPPNYGRDYADKFSSIYTRVAKDSKSELVPFLLDGVAENQQLFQPDRIHPTAAAQSIMLDNVWPHLKPLLAK
jgi:acyl-CoA thioesterase I